MAITTSSSIKVNPLSGPVLAGAPAGNSFNSVFIKTNRETDFMPPCNRDPSIIIRKTMRLGNSGKENFDGCHRAHLCLVWASASIRNGKRRLGLPCSAHGRLLPCGPCSSPNRGLVKLMNHARLAIVTNRLTVASTGMTHLAVPFRYRFLPSVPCSYTSRTQNTANAPVKLPLSFISFEQTVNSNVAGMKSA